MKKALSLTLVVLMVAGIFAAFAITSSADDTTLWRYGNGMENWGGSPNKGDQDAATQILICPLPWDGEYYVEGFEMKINMKAVDGSSDDTFTAKAVTRYNAGDWGILRYEPCLMSKPWVPVKDVHYTLTATFKDVNGKTVTLQPTDDDGNVVEYFLDADPFTKGAAPQPPKAGEGTTAIIVLGAIALLGTGVVVTKKVFAK